MREASSLRIVALEADDAIGVSACVRATRAASRKSAVLDSTYAAMPPPGTAATPRLMAISRPAFRSPMMIGPALQGTAGPSAQGLKIAHSRKPTPGPREADQSREAHPQCLPPHA